MAKSQFGWHMTIAITHPDAGTYTISYGDAVDLGCADQSRFIAMKVYFSVKLDENEGSEEITVTSKEGPEINGNLAKITSK